MTESLWGDQAEGFRTVNSRNLKVIRKEMSISIEEKPPCVCMDVE